MKGATEDLANQMKTLASMVFQCPVEAIELADGFARIADNPEAALPFMALGAIPNANNAGFPVDPPMNAASCTGRRSTCPTRSGSSGS